MRQSQCLYDNVLLFEFNKKELTMFWQVVWKLVSQQQDYEQQYSTVIMVFSFLAFG